MAEGTTMTGFADLVQAALPAGRRLPDELRAALDHLEAIGARIDNEHGSFVRLYPGEPEDGQSGVYFAVPDADHLRHYTGNPDAAETSSVVPIARTGGDGSYAALWFDGDRTRYGHLGSGSGSSWVGLIADDTVGFLRFLAIGYGEPAWPEVHALTPAEDLARELAEADDADGAETFAWQPPDALRSWLRTTFGVEVPERATEIVAVTPHIDAESDDDPFWRQVAAISR
ncbi:hypothetical protein ACIRN4_15475 [Pimelobacter simplex]|uniref:hypothetical protein n=1 Tax=Nocardioides simplex TaxID=2045 RepID=UPI0037FD50E7